MIIAKPHGIDHPRVPDAAREKSLPELVEESRRWRASPARIQARILRFENGNLGDHKAVGGGVWEARLDFGPGYRLYFGKDGNSVILLLTGGDKASQPKDIGAAKLYWDDFRKEVKHDTTQ